MFELSNLKKIAERGTLAPRPMAGCKALDEAALADGAIPKKYKELMAIAVALTTQCTYCIEIHRKAALVAGATEIEFGKTVFIATALRAGAALTHGTHLLMSKLERTQ
jgi:AhpD family alkylhydroperoxidase